MNYKEIFLSELRKDYEEQENPSLKAAIKKVIEIIETQSLYKAAIYDFLILRIKGYTYEDLFQVPDIRQAFIDMIKNPNLKSPKEDIFTYDIVDTFKDRLNPEIWINDKEIRSIIKDMTFEQAKRFFGGYSTNKLFADKEIYETIKKKAESDERFYAVMDYSEFSIADGTCRLIALHDKGGNKLVHETPEVQLIVLDNLDPSTNMDNFLYSFKTYSKGVQEKILSIDSLVEQLIIKHTNKYLREPFFSPSFESELISKHFDFIKELSYEQKFNFICNMSDAEMQKYLITKLKFVDNLLSHNDFGDFFKYIKDQGLLVESLCNLEILKKINSITFRQLLPTLDLETQKKIYNNEVFQTYLRHHLTAFELMNIIASFHEEIIELILPRLAKIEISDLLILYRNTHNHKYIKLIEEELAKQKEANADEYENNRKYMVNQFLGRDLVATLTKEEYEYFLNNNKDVFDIESALAFIDRFYIPSKPQDKDYEIAATIVEGEELTKPQIDALTNIRTYEVYEKGLEKALNYIKKIDGRIIKKISYEILNMISEEDRKFVLDHMETSSLIYYIAASPYFVDYCYDLYTKDSTIFDNIEEKEENRVIISGDQLKEVSIDKIIELFYKVSPSIQEQLINDVLLSNQELLTYIKNQIKENPNVYSGGVYRTIDKYLTKEELQFLLEHLSLNNLIKYYTKLFFELQVNQEMEKIKNAVLLARKDEIIHEINLVQQSPITSVTTDTIIDNIYKLVDDKEAFLRTIKPSLLIKIYDLYGDQATKEQKNKLILKLIKENPSALINSSEKDIKTLLSKLSSTELKDLISQYNTTDLVELFAKSQNKDIEETLMAKFNENSLFINNTSLSIEEIFSRLEEENKQTIYNKIDEEFSLLELPNGIKDKLRKSSYDEKIFLIYGSKNNVFNEEKYELISSLLQQDPFALNSLNINLLNDDIFSISKNIIPKIYRYETLTNTYIELIKKNTTRSKLLLLIVEYLNKTSKSETVFIQKIDAIINYLTYTNDETLDRYSLKNINEQELFELIEYMLIDSTDYLVATSMLAQPNMYIPRENPSNANTFTEIEQERQKALDIKFMNETDLSKCKNIMFDKYFKITLDEAKSVQRRYITSIKEIMPYVNNKEVLILLNEINQIINIEDLEELRELYLNKQTKYNVEDYLYMFEELTAAYNKSIASSLKGFKNGKQEPLALLTEDEMTLVSVIELEDDFDMFVHSTDAYGSMEMINDNYFDSWTFSDKTSNHGICTSYISNSNLGTAKVKGKGVMFGFVNLNESSISSLAPYDLVSRNEGIITTTRRPAMFTDTKTLADYTRHTHNEAVLERRNVSPDSKYPVIQPDCIIIFEEMSLAIKHNAIQAQKDFKAMGVEIPIVYINRRKVVEKEAKRVAEMIKAYEQEPNLELLKEIINKYESNRCGLDFEENLNPQEMFQKDKIYELINKTIDLINQTGDKVNAIKLIEIIEHENNKFTLIKESIGDRAHSFDLLDEELINKLQQLKNTYSYNSDGTKITI